MNKTIYLLLFLALFNFNCKSTTNGTSCEQGLERVTVVNKTGLDGCGFMLQRADNSAFEVSNFPDSLKVEGKTFCIKYHLAKQQMSICMGGQIIDILEVQK